MTDVIGPLLGPLTDEPTSVWHGVKWQPADIGLAAVNWWGGSVLTWKGEAADGTQLLSKCPRAHVGAIAPAHAGVARQAAAEVHLGPRLLHLSAEHGITVEQYLTGRPASLSDARNPHMRGEMIRLRARFRAASVTLPARDLGTEAEALIDLVLDRGIDLAPTLADLTAELGTLRAAVADGPAPLPAWLSSEVSDFLITENGMLLTGGHSAGNADPLADIGALVAELCPAVADIDTVLSAACAQPHPGARARVLIWSLIVDLRAALLALIADDADPSSPMNYAMYAALRTWRLGYRMNEFPLKELITTARTGWA